MRTGIIYRAFNRVSGKSYIGQTCSTLDRRKIEHYSDVKRKRYKFQNALNKYNKEDWVWTTLIETEQYKLDYYERHFIKEFGSHKNGYNSTPGGKMEGKHHHKYSDKLYYLYKPNYGEIVLTRTELLKIDNAFSHIEELQKEQIRSIKGFVLSKYKDQYNQIFNIERFFHLEHGLVEGNCTELAKKYNLYSKAFFALLDKSHFVSCGWVLEENMEEYKRKYKPETRTLSHPEYGILKCTRQEFTKKFNLNPNTVKCLWSEKAKLKRLKGWTLID